MFPRLLVLLLLAGCSAAPPSEHDSGTPDAGHAHPGHPDGGHSDAGGADAGKPDAGEPDAGEPDAGAADAGAPDAGADDSAVLRVHYPAGTGTLFVRGSGGGLSWTQGVAMTPGADDVWTLTLDDLDGTIEWKPLLDDTTWARGPNSHASPGQTLEVFPHFNAAEGTVTKLFPAFSSAALGNARDIWVYLPPVYLQNGRARLPVLYMHDGQNLFDPNLASFGVEWRVDEAFNAAAESGTCDDDRTKSCQNDGDCPGSACHTFAPAIVVGVNNTSNRIAEYTPTADPTYGGGNGHLYLQFLATELKPQVDQALRTLPGREHTLILGSSLGGLISAYAGLTQPNVWGRVGAMSPSAWWDDRYIVGAVSASASQSPKPSPVYVDCGDAGASRDGKADTEQLAAAYRQVGYSDGSDFLFIVSPGDGHNEAAWAKRFPWAMRFLLGPKP